MPAAAITPATTRIQGAPVVSLEARRYAATKERKPPVRAVITHSVGAPAVHTPKGAVNSTGSGFHDGPPPVEKPRCGLAVLGAPTVPHPRALTGPAREGGSRPTARRAPGTRSSTAAAARTAAPPTWTPPPTARRARAAATGRA